MKDIDFFESVTNGGINSKANLPESRSMLASLHRRMWVTEKMKRNKNY